MTIPLADQIGEVETELAIRRNVYPYQVAKGKMEQAEADRRMANMEAVLATLRWIERNRDRIIADAARVDTPMSEAVV